MNGMRDICCPPDTGSPPLVGGGSGYHSPSFDKHWEPWYRDELHSVSTTNVQYIPSHETGNIQMEGKDQVWFLLYYLYILLQKMDIQITQKNYNALLCI